MVPDQRPVLIAIGYNTYGTGLTRVMHELLRPLATRYDVHFLGIGYKGPYLDDGIKWYPTNENGGDVFAQFQAEELIQKLQPELVFVVQDLWMFEQYMRCFKPYLDKIRLVAYIPLDGNISDPSLVEPLLDAHAVVAYTSWAEHQFQQAFATYPDKKSPTLHVVNHATDIHKFRPDEELLAAAFHPAGRTSARRKVFEQAMMLRSGSRSRGFADSAYLAPDFLDRVTSGFLVLNGARPSERKRIDITIEGFARFATGKPDVFLCLHHSFSNEATVREIEVLGKRFGIADQVLFNPLNPEGNAVTDEQLNQLYNACDVGVNTSMGEGWGLVNFEHAATGAAQIVPDHSACGELWQECGVLLGAGQAHIPRFSLLEMSQVDPADLAQSLDKLYGDREFLQQLSNKAYRQVTRMAQFTWRQASEQFSRVFDECVNASPERVEA